ncbi:hypothetical protein M2428_001316 [Arthrobacter sp. ES3-54]|nr:hypothetical protein [Arthrobacter sp. ES3-54]
MDKCKYKGLTWKIPAFWRLIHFTRWQSIGKRPNA